MNLFAKKTYPIDILCVLCIWLILNNPQISIYSDEGRNMSTKLEYSINSKIGLKFHISKSCVLHYEIKRF